MRWIAWLGFAGVCLGVGCNSGCSGKRAGRLQADAPADVASNGPPGPFGAEPPAHASTDPPSHPGHRFTARTPPPRHRPSPPPASLQSLPSFVDGSSRCFPQPVGRRYPPPPHPYRKPLPYSARGESGGSGLGAAPPRSAAPKTAQRPRSQPAEPQAAQHQPLDIQPVDPSAIAERSHGGPPPPQAPWRDTEPPSAEWGAAIYLSNDDSMSLSSAQRVIWAIDRYQPIPREHVRPHELLNYFSFQTARVEPQRDFSVVANIEPKPEEPGIYSLALAVQGRTANTETRRNANLAYVIDRSGSMAAEGRMEYLKRGLLRSLAELKHGDIVHLVLFDTTACTLAQNFVVGRDSHQRLADLIRRIEPRGATNLHDGLSHGYTAADRAYQPAYTNRVVLVTDALTNTGVTNQGLISLVAKHYDARRIRLSGVGVGSDFNDALLDELTERGKGAYVFLGSEAEVDAVFGTRFASLIETIAEDVHFKLHLPPSLAMNVFYGEEASVHKERVQAVHYFAGTAQLFLSDLRSRYGQLATQDDIMLTIEYEDPEAQGKQVEEYAFNLGEILGESRNVRKAQLIDRFIREVRTMASRPLPERHAYRPAAWYDEDAYAHCAQVRSDLATLASGQTDDSEVLRVQSLWDKFCDRYAATTAPPVLPLPRPLPQQKWQPSEPLRPRTNDYPPPQRSNDGAPPAGWPSARL